MRPCFLAPFTPARSPSCLQGRDPFSGDCDSGRNAASALAIWVLAGTRPVFRGLRLEIPPACMTHCVGVILQGRDPFSGDCEFDRAHRLAGCAAGVLQGRDPFSGDCDLLSAAEGRAAASALAGTRPVFRGLRRHMFRLVGEAGWILAGTRPVFRGLRPERRRCRRSRRRSPPCRDETRFQGIATGRERGGLPPEAPACRDETRFQGIATLDQRPGPGDQEIHLAGTRPVFRGLRHRPRGLSPPGLHAGPCRDETRFQGIATRFP